MAPGWLLDVFASLMLVVAAVSATRLAAAALPADRLSAAGPIGSRSWPDGSGGVDTDIADLLMGIAMAGMLLAGLTTLRPGAWEAIFGVLTAWFAWRFARDITVDGVRSLATGYCALHSAAMVYMFAALRMSDGMDTLEYPPLALAFTSVFVGYSVWGLYRLFARRHFLGPHHRPAPPPAATVACRTAISVTMVFLLLIMM